MPLHHAERAGEALAVLATLDPDHGPVAGYPTYWNQVVFNHHHLGHDEEALAAARDAKARHTALGLRLEVQILAALGRVEEVDSLFQLEGEICRGGTSFDVRRATWREYLAHGHQDTMHVGASKVGMRTSQQTALDTSSAVGIAALCTVVFGRPVRWATDVISTSLALAVAAITKTSRFCATAVLNLGLVFEVVISFGITAAEYSALYASNQYGPGDYGGVGMSGVAVWVLLYTMVVPTQPRKALLAMIASVSAVPIVLASRIRFGSVEFAPGWTEFTLGMVLQYGLVVLMGYVGARVVYKMGSDVGRAREMGSYRLMDRIGRGGMGEVWKAKHRMLARAAAIKLVPPDVLGASGLGRETILGRFEREAQATASMRSPHTIELYDFGVADNGMFFYVMELLRGLDLSSLVGRFGPVPPERAIHILRQTCHSLAEAHEAGLIHRDVKPANIFVARYGRDVDFVKVLDFGLVKSLTQDVADAYPHLTAAGNIAGGTPAYIAPEQALGHPVDGRTDVYALGCVAYWLVTGKPVFEGETAMGLISDHLRTAPVPPSQRVDWQVPEDLEGLIMRCLEKAPERRPQSADEFADALDACEAAGRWTQERARAWWAEEMTEEQRSWKVSFS